MPTRVLLSRRHFGRRHTATATATATLHGTTPDSLAHTRSIGRREAERVEGVELAGRVRLRFEEGEAAEDEGDEEQVAAVEDDRRRAGVGWTRRARRTERRKESWAQSPDPADRGCHGDVGRRLRVSQQASKQAAGEEASANHQSWGWAGCGLGWLAGWLAGCGGGRVLVRACVRRTRAQRTEHREAGVLQISHKRRQVSCCVHPFAFLPRLLIFPLGRTEDTGRPIHAETPTALRSRPSQPLPHTKHVGGSL